MKNNHIVNIDKQIKSAMLLASICGSLLLPSVADAFPFMHNKHMKIQEKQQGRIVCANCHLGAKPTEIEVPQGVLPDTVFEAVVEIPYDKSLKQVTADGSKGPLNVGAVVVLPEGFKLAPKERLSDELKKATEGVVISPYSDSKQSILVVGPIPGDNHQKIVFPILSPNPAENRDVHFIKYPIYVGGNRGRGQVQPTGEKSNNTIYTSPVSGQLVKVEASDKLTTLTINSKSGEAVTVKIPLGPEIIVKEGADLKADQPLTVDPNVGGFGQAETEIVLQSPARVKGLIAFFFTVIFAQVLLVLKKKQFEKVQLAEMNF